MAPPPDTAVARALRSACEAAGVTQKQVAEAAEVDQTTVSAWMKGKNWLPLYALPLIDELCGQPKGYVLRLAGYVDDNLDVEAQIQADFAFADPEDRDMVVRFYRRMRSAASLGTQG